MVRENFNWKLIALGYGIFSLGVLVIAIVLALILSDWTLVYAVILLCPSLLVIETLNLVNLKLIDKQVRGYASKKKIILSSVFLYSLKSILLVVPFLVGVLINTYIKNVFNIYMMIAFMCFSLIIFSLLFFLDNKQRLRIKSKKEESENYG